MSGPEVQSDVAALQQRIDKLQLIVERLIRAHEMVGSGTVEPAFLTFEMEQARVFLERPDVHQTVVG